MIRIIIMKLPYLISFTLIINALISFEASFGYSSGRPSRPFGGYDPILLVAKCGYICWPKYGNTDGKPAPNAADNNLDNYQIGALRGCMEECFIREIDSDVYPPLNGPNYRPWSSKLPYV